ncbi:hypothetical protein AX774_g2391 [Zancudomyces culisetae]|uniref:Uncharacterized protein n=1 Tax=Zancudomyces culisetae TaxID=1213189 RepID=A0A1R1PT29_ZANCU|nr:hypothetical protein AX774_g2391 [Zancudomyces culisetae]|eukprot:OMH84094.1 hypothetical protein AX774_g2391 [Zancudomyces culisetae]
MLLVNIWYISGLRDSSIISFSSCCENAAAVLLFPDFRTSIPTTLTYGLRIATAPPPPFPVRLLWYTENTPVIRTRAPGYTRFTKYSSLLITRCRGNSPTGMLSGSSCSFSVC